ncbi:hypothetical protein LXL04_035107 [Taraxacum kok-saghyz]
MDLVHVYLGFNKPSDHGQLRDGEAQTRASHRISHDPKDYLALGVINCGVFTSVEQLPSLNLNVSSRSHPWEKHKRFAYQGPTLGQRSGCLSRQFKFSIRTNLVGDKCRSRSEGLRRSLEQAEQNQRRTSRGRVGGSSDVEEEGSRERVGSEKELQRREQLRWWRGIRDLTREEAR